MRVIIEKDYDKMSKWAANHVVETINKFQPSAERHSYWDCLRVLHLRHVCRAGEGSEGGTCVIQARLDIQYGRIRGLARGASGELPFVYGHQLVQSYRLP